MDAGFALGVDMGGTHVSAAMVNVEAGAPLPHTHCRSALNATGTVDEITATCCGVIRQSWASAGVQNSQVGIAMPGPFDYEEGICLIKKQEKFRSLFGINFKNLLAAELGINTADVKFINDASAFLKGEVIAGAMAGVNDAIGITLGTGLGSAYYHNSQVTDAELWLMPFKYGMAEDYLSTRWFINEYQLQYHKTISGVKELTRANVTEAAAIFNVFAENLAQFIRLAAEKFNCNNVVLGGNIAKASSFFEGPVRDILYKSNCAAGLSIAELGEGAALIGAAGLFQQKNRVKIC